MFKSLLKSLSGGEVPAERSREQAQELIAAGNTAEDAGRLQEALDLYRRAAALAPQLPAAHLNLGIAQEALGDAASARASYERVLALELDHPFGAYNLGKLDFVQGRLESAEALLRRALARKPDFPQACTVLASVLEARGQLEAAADAIAEAVRLQPEDGGALSLQTGILARLGRLDEAEAAAARAAALLPQDADAQAVHAFRLVDQGFAAEAMAPLRRAIELAPHRFELRSRELFLLNLVEGVDVRDLAARHRALGARLEAAVPARAHVPRDAAGRRLRIGFVSGDFLGHPVTLFLLPVLERRSRDRFEVFCYSSTRKPDAFTRQVQQLSDHWVDASGWHDLRLAEAIAADAIDILVDLSGHTSTARLGAFAAKPAPVQVTWVGYLNTTGLTRMDYRLTDARCDPPEMSQSLHTEQLLLFPHSQWCYRPFLVVEPAPAAPCERNGYVTFGSFNNTIKLTHETAWRWGRILRELPTARLLVAGVGSERKRQSLLEAIVEGGGEAARVRFAPRTDLQGYYELMNQVDIALDSYPYGGGTTTFDALWMGVPVVACTGPLPASRSAASVLEVLGLPDWVAPDISRYQEVAVERTRDTAAIAHLRRTLRERLRASPLMDEAGFVAAFEALLEQAWRERGAGVAQPQRVLPPSVLPGRQ
ncbi:MAG: tetratricopeptide repeat protein [Burkholderiales bacterium]|nr:tetratricopeptide repeat protein [Burkholderiales bacterium]